MTVPAYPAFVPAFPSTPLRWICAWCPGFDARHPSNAGATHGMCESCAADFAASIVEADREQDTEADDREELSGSTCGTACGFCGRCS